MPKNAEKICSTTVGKILRSERRFFPTVAWEIRFIRFFRPFPVMIVCYFMHFCAHFASLPQPHFLTSTSLLYCLWAVMDYPSQLSGSLSAAWLAYYLAMSLLLHQLQDYPPTHFRFFCIIYSCPFTTSTSPHYCTPYFILPPIPPPPASSTPSPWPCLPPIFAFLNTFMFFLMHMHILFYIQCICIISSNQWSVFDRFFWKQ